MSDQGIPQGIAWSQDLDQARQRAKAQGKNIFLDFFLPG